MAMLAVILVVSGALLAGALWGLYASLGSKTEGFLIALAGGALIVSLSQEMVGPALENASATAALCLVLAGAAVFTGIDWLIGRTWGADSGGGLLAAITLDGIPENLALGVSLIGTGPAGVAALAGSIFLSNLPEAAGGAKEMADSGRTQLVVFGYWAATAGLLSAAAIIGNLALRNVGEGPLALIKCFAAGAVVASLATEVFPKAYKEDHKLAGIATALGLVLAFALGELGQ